MSTQRVRMADVCSMVTGKLDSNAAVENGDYPFFTCAQETFWIDR
jgi:type I restriction enzyme, S subunit